MLMFNGGSGGGGGGSKDSFWLQLEVCREFQRSRCTRTDDECKFAHPPKNVEIQSNGRVTACYDSIKGRCTRDSCKYMHPPDHLKDQLLINGRNHLALKNALIQQQQHAVVSAATAAVQFQQQQQQTDPRSGHHLHHQHHAQLHPNLHQQHSHHLHHSHPNQHQQQQQAALFQSAIAAAAAQHQQHHHEQHYHQQAVAAAFNRAAMAAAAAAAAANSSSSISPNNNNNNHNHHHHHNNNNNNNSSNHLNKPQQQVAANQYDLSTQQLPTALAPVIAAFSMNPFMTPGAFSSPHTFAANQYAAAVAAAAAAAQTAAPAASMHQTSASHDTSRKSSNSNCQPDAFISKTSSSTASQLSTSSGGIIKAPPTHYNHRPTSASTAASVAAAAAAAVAAASSIGPSGPATDPLTAVYYMNPAMFGAPPVSGCDSTSDQQQANAAVAAQAHYQAVLSAALNNYGQQRQPTQSLKIPPNYAEAIRVAQPSTTVAKVAPVSQQQKQQPQHELEEEKVEQTCDKEKLTTAQNETASGQQQQLKSEENGHETGSDQVELTTIVADQRIVKVSKCKASNHDDVGGENEDEEENNNCDGGRATKRPHLDLSSSSWLSPASSSGSGSNTSSDATTPSSGDRRAFSSSLSPGQSVSLDKQQQQPTGANLTNKSQPSGEMFAASEQPQRQQQHNVELPQPQPPPQPAPMTPTNGLSCHRQASEATRSTSSLFRVEICREFLRSSCRREEHECRFAHPPRHVLDARSQVNISSSNNNNNKEADYVTVCMDFLKGRCARNGLKCRYLHPVAHLQYQLISSLQQQQQRQPIPTTEAFAGSSLIGPLSLSFSARALH